MEAFFVNFLIRYRYALSIASIIAVVLFAQGAKNLYFQGDYKSFFDPDDPQLLAHEAIESEYTKSDSVSFLIKPPQGDIFNQTYLTLIQNLTDELWRIPYSVRVDSLANYQFSEAIADELSVADLIPFDFDFSSEAISRVKQIALKEPELINKFISRDGNTALVRVVLEIPETKSNISREEYTAQQKRANEIAEEIATVTQAIEDRLKSEYVGTEVHRIGVPLLNYYFNKSSETDAEKLVPLMYVIILIALGLFFRSLGSIVACLVVIGCSSAAALGAAGWAGFTLNSVTTIAPVVILTIAVCDTVHLTSVFQRALSRGLAPIEALHESLTINLQPVFLTSVTTMVGFLTLNASESPLSRAFGNICAFGVMFAMMISLTLLPTILVLLVRKASVRAGWQNSINRFGEFIVSHRKATLFIPLLVAVALITLVPLNVINNDPTDYLKQGTPYRDAADFSQDNLPGIYDINFSLHCGEPNCINEPEYLRQLDAFTEWLLQQPEVENATSYADVAKRLNRNMHGDDPAHYRVPESKDLAAQYQLLYELSLPFGLDLNNQVNFDKSATKVNVWLSRVLTAEILDFESRANQWLLDNAPALATRGASVNVMFAVQTLRDIDAMIVGAILAIIGVTITMVLATRSIKYGLLSMIPNAFPAAMGMGMWAMLVGMVNMAVSLVFSITLGLVVDNTVHFISKYRRARAHGDTSEQSVIYAFNTVGLALTITACVLTLGFGLLAISDFNLNVYLGGLTAITIVIALVFDLLVLPALLLFIDAKKPPTTEHN